MPAYYNQRDEIADTLMAQKGASTFDYGLAGLGSAQQPMMPMTGPPAPTTPGMPAAVAGGVPGAGIGPAGASNVQLPPQRLGTQGAMPMMGGLGQLRGSGQMSNMEAANAAGSLGRMRGMGQMSDIEAAQAGQSLGRMRRPRY